MRAARLVYDSNAFAKWLGEQRDRGRYARWFFVCGDSDGFPDSLRERVKTETVVERVMIIRAELGAGDAGGTDLPGVCDLYQGVRTPRGRSLLVLGVAVGELSRCGRVGFAAFHEMMCNDKNYGHTHCGG